MVTNSQKKLFTPVQVGAISLKHRIVMPPMSRLRAEWPSGVPSDLMLNYYSQRASDGGLMMTEATAISSSGRGYRGAPGIYTPEQVAGWKTVTDAALLQRLAAVRGRLSLCADQAAAAKWWLSMPMASVSAEGPMPKALSTRRTSPLMPGCRHQGRACPLRRARMTSNPLIVA